MKKYLVISLLCTFSTISFAQEIDEHLPFYEIGDYPEDYNSGNIIARSIDGLGYRYYWATKGLLQEDLDYKTVSSARSSLEVLEHILGLSNVILNTIKNKPTVKSELGELSFKEIRSQTLNNLNEARQLIAGEDAESLAKMKLSFQRGEDVKSYEFWHLLNGPLADALWHTGQIVAFRRASGNPIDVTVNVFSGKNANR